MTREHVSVSVIIPAFNSMPFLATTVASVFAQTVSVQEIIVVDDGSEDDTEDFISHLFAGSKHKYLRLAENSGSPSKPRNDGMACATGDYIAFLDADDWWHPKKLELQLQAIDQYKADFCCSGAFSFTTENELEPTERVNSELRRHISLNGLIKKNHIKTSSVLLSRSHLPSFSEDPKGYAVEDYKAWLDLFSNSDYRGIELASGLFGYRIRQGSLSRSKLKMMRRVWNLLSDFQIKGRSLGLRRYYYFLTYVYFSVKERMHNRT